MSDGKGSPASEAYPVSAQAEERKTFVAVQYLRAIAALLVVGIHLQEQLERAGWSVDLIDFGAAGVDIFFVVSGFIMWQTTTRPISPLTFYYRRIVRIVPLYWLLTSVMLAVLLVAPSLVNSARYDPVHVIASYLFIAQPHPVLTDAVFPLLVPGWTLNYEMFFYAIFGVMLLFGRHSRIILLVAVLGILSTLHMTVADRTSVAGFYTNPILMEFAAGAMLGYAVERGAWLRWSWAWLPIIGGTILIIAHLETIRILRDGIGAILIVWGVVLAEVRTAAPRQRLALLLGDASYSLYLVHALVLAAWFHIFQRVVGIGSLGTAALYVVSGLIGVIVAAVLLYRGFEKPSLALLRGKTAQKKASRAW